MPIWQSMNTHPVDNQDTINTVTTGQQGSVLLYQEGSKSPFLKEPRSNSVRYLAKRSGGANATQRPSNHTNLDKSNSGILLEGSSVSLGQGSLNMANSFLNNLDRVIGQLESQTLRGPTKVANVHSMPQTEESVTHAQRHRKKDSEQHVGSSGQKSEMQRLNFSKSKPVTAITHRRALVPDKHLEQWDFLHQRETIKSQALSEFSQRRSSLAAKTWNSGQVSGKLSEMVKTTSRESGELTARLRPRSGSLPKFLQERYAESLSKHSPGRRLLATHAEPTGYYLSKEQFDMLTEKCSFAIQKYTECEHKIELLERKYNNLKSSTENSSNYQSKKTSSHKQHKEEQRGYELSAVSMRSPNVWAETQDLDRSVPGPFRSGNVSIPFQQTGSVSTESRPISTEKVHMALAPRRRVFDFNTQNMDGCFSSLGGKSLRNHVDRKMSHRGDVNVPLTLESVKDQLKNKLGGGVQSGVKEHKLPSKKITM